MIGKEERAAVLRVMDRGILSGYRGCWDRSFCGGQEIKALEREWEAYFGVKHAIACNSATSGLWMACAAIGLQQHIPCNFDKIKHYDVSETIVSPYSMTCSASIPLHFGCKPVFADIEGDYYYLDPNSVEKAISERTKAIIVVDLFGQPYDADAINSIAEKYSKKYGHKIYVIEDAAQAIGAKCKGKYAGTLGDIGVYSLNVHKHIHCGEGGVVVTDNDELAMKIRLAMNHSEAVVNDMGIKYCKATHPVSYHLYESIIGMNMRMTELQAAVAREQLKKLEGILKSVREHAKYFPVKVRPDCEHAYYRYAMTYSEWTKLPEEWHYMYNWKQHYITPLYKLPLFQSLGYDQNQCPVCEEVEENIVLAWLRETP